MPQTKKYRVTVKVDGSLPDIPHFAGKTGNAFPDWTCEVEVDADHTGYACHPAQSAAFHRYPHLIRGEMVEYEIVEVQA